MGHDPVHCQGNLGSVSRARKLEPAVSQEHNGVHGGNGADYLQAAVWQCPLLAARLAGRIMAQSRAGVSLCRGCTTTPWDGARAAGKQRGRSARLQAGARLLPSPQPSCASGDCGSSPKMLMEMLKYKEILRMGLICEALRLSALRIPQ